jgi:hypothetical protein
MEGESWYLNGSSLTSSKESFSAEQIVFRFWKSAFSSVTSFRFFQSAAFARYRQHRAQQSNPGHLLPPAVAVDRLLDARRIGHFQRIIQTLQVSIVNIGQADTIQFQLLLNLFRFQAI